MLKKLNRETANAPIPGPVRILQFGKGNFLRAFVDWMVDILNEKAAFDGAVQIVQVNSTETDNRFDDQEGLYHVVINGIRNAAPLREIRLIKAVTGVINPHHDYKAFLAQAENPNLEFIVSNTTEAGITFDPSDSKDNQPPKSFPGKLTALLHHRYRSFNGDSARTLTILPCELIEKNGESLREAICRYIEHWNLGSDFENWIRQHTVFCNTLVDRIVPGYPKDNSETIWKETGFEDHLVVSAEPYHLWVIEPIPAPGADPKRLRAKLPLERVGVNVKFVSDLSQYRLNKVRILNGAHTCMVPVAYLRGLRTVKEAVEDPFTGEFISKAIRDEIMPTLAMPEKELQEFAHDVMERFQNPYIRHELKSIALNSVSKFAVRVLPTILDYIAMRKSVPERLTYALASLIVFYRGEWRGEKLPVNDNPEVVNFFKSVWQTQNVGMVPKKVLSNTDLWKRDLTNIEGMTSSVESHLSNILRTQ